MQSSAGSSLWLAATLSPEALITSVSFCAERVTGYSARELAGLPVTRILADSSAFEVPAILKYANDWGSWEGEIIHRGRDGGSLEARGTLTVLAGNEGPHSGYLLISNFDSPSTSEKGGHLIAVDTADKLRAIAHELSNPLAVMMGFAQLISLDENCSERIRSDVGKMYSELQRLVAVVDKLRSVAVSLYGTSSNRIADRLH